MRNKHLHIEADSQLLAEIRRRVKAELKMDRATFRGTFALKAVLYLGASGAFYANLFFAEDPVLFVLSYVLYGLSMLLLAFNFAHDFSHNTIFRSKRWNSLGFLGIYTLLGAHGEAWRERHVHAHHFAPNVQKYDSDLQITNLIRIAPDMPHRWYHRFQAIYAPIAYSIYSLYWIFIKDFILLWDKLRQRAANPAYVLAFIGQKAFYLFYLLALPLIFASQSAQVVLLGFLAMHLVQSVLLLFTFFMTHHVLATAYPATNEQGVIQTSWLMNQVQSSNDMHPFSRTANFILGGFNNHIAHHLFPNINHIYYPRLSQILYEVLRAHGIQPNYTSYLGGAISHWRLLKKMSKNGADSPSFT